MPLVRQEDLEALGQQLGQLSRGAALTRLDFEKGNGGAAEKLCKLVGAEHPALCGAASANLQREQG